jgi:hypothetical protein
MFVRAKKSGAYQYLQLVRSERVDGRVRQQVIATLGRLDCPAERREDRRPEQCGANVCHPQPAARERGQGPAGRRRRPAPDGAFLRVSRQ